MLMTGRLTQVEAETEVQIFAEHVPFGISHRDHQIGMASLLETLAKYVEFDFRRRSAAIWIYRIGSGTSLSGCSP